MKKYQCLVFLFALFLCFSLKVEAQQTLDKEKCFEYVFGDKVKLDPMMVKKVCSDPSGKRYYVDRNGDGKPEEVWYVDVDPRHSVSKRPILVRAIDRDGDMQMGGQPDFDSDLYIVDWNGDGKVDAVIGYQDLDGDNDVDRMGIYYFDPKYGLCVWWSSDDGDDNLLWYDVNYAYDQRACEQKTNFGGDETFDHLYIKPGDQRWTTFSENPFCFFDRDGDGISEEAIRLVGIKQTIHSLRWSFDVDNDATKENPRDYDVSLSAIVGDKNSGQDNESSLQSIKYGDDMCETVMIEGYPAKIMRRNAMVPFLQKQVWSREIMTWDENDLNIAYGIPGYNIERWEGVIAAESKDRGYEMPRVGGPDCGPYNKRYEIVMHPKAPNTYYYSAGDKRIHIKGSDKTWLNVDFNYDNKIDMKYEWIDTNHDGIVDKVLLDANGDGKWDDSWKLNVLQDKPVEWNFNSLNSAYSCVVSMEPSRLYTLNRILYQALKSRNKSDSGSLIWNMIENKMHCKNLSEDLSERLLNSNESMLYYLRLCADLRICELKKNYTHKSFWRMFEVFRGNGETDSMCKLLSKEFGVTMPSSEEYELWLSDLRKKPDIKRVAWNNKWFAPNWGWESEKAAYRCYDGHFDLFGKRYDCLMLPMLTHDIHYHTDHGTWGMDILHVGQTGGCGGLVLYVNGIAYPLRHEKEGDPVYSGHLVQESNDSVTIGFTVSGAGPKDHPYTVYINCTARAGEYSDKREVKVEGGSPSDDIQLGIVINKIPTEDFFLDTSSGVMGLWGFQDPAMGWIGMGIMFPPDHYIGQKDTEEEHRAIFKIDRGEWLHFYAQGDWLRGHRFVPGAGAKDWEKELRQEALLYNLK